MKNDSKDRYFLNYIKEQLYATSENVPSRGKDRILVLAYYDNRPCKNVYRYTGFDADGDSAEFKYWRRALDI